MHLYFARQNVQAPSALAYHKDSFFQSVKERCHFVISDCESTGIVPVIVTFSEKYLLNLQSLPYSILQDYTLHFQMHEKY